METALQHLSSLTASDLFRNTLVAFLLLIVTSIVAHIATKTIRHITTSEKSPFPSNSIFINIGRVIVWGTGVSIILDSCFGVNMSAIVTALGVGGIAISLGAQDTLSNLIGGLQVTAMRIIEPGDNIEVGSDMGVVQDVSWRHTTIKNRLGETVIIPNSIISKTALTILPPANRFNVPFAVTETTNDMDGVRDRIRREAENAVIPISDIEEGPNVFFTDITEYGFKGKVIIRISDASKVNEAIDAVVRAIADDTRGYIPESDEDR
ncbi:Small-conductance mechanosensitive channel [Slackia heliotrinireducens]|uniref:Small-conductance mechanosensitive channel n=1 Tax=Slackia heliotrinireducens (strain ATCC 29202 / DSM 20476 / NCTC 11029 / RHS 1) TaxID=471855 RepID=C7N7X8_SLAHD|nr:mechanosensitive ion channel domain-containing protein [Slackia heliotrinireducens]ACV23013.1 small-conductance mechanosensitive channel [Slackia heliotrinireducens DSM 20476]VEH01919.1 Small-conductance mechanosensitive channel [Slackia heliotrinireducens]